jgi:hypothetical protein
VVVGDANHRGPDIWAMTTSPTRTNEVEQRSVFDSKPQAHTSSWKNSGSVLIQARDIKYLRERRNTWLLKRTQWIVKTWDVT